MEQQFVIETDFKTGIVLVYAVSKRFTDKVVYEREANIKGVVCRALGPKFYGELDALLVTADKIQQAKPIVPELAEK